MRESRIDTLPRGHKGIPRLRVALLSISLWGCHPLPPSVEGNGVLAESAAVLMPDASPGERATLRLGAPPTSKRGGVPAAEFEVGIVRARDGSDTVLKLFVGREPMEREIYESRAEAFRVVAAADDGFAPPLDLVRYPARDGASWAWEGKVLYAGISREATARVTLGHDGDELRSEVALSIQADAGRAPLERRFSFGFRKGRGVVRRIFGDVSSRRPVGEAWRP